MAYVEKFYTKSYPTITGWGTPLKEVRFIRGWTKGNRKTPNAHVSKRDSYTWKFADIVTGYRTGPWQDFTTTTYQTGPSFVTASQIDPWNYSGSSIGPDHSIVYEMALRQLFKHIKRPEWNATVFGLELGKSFDMIVNTASRMYAAMKALKRGRLGDAYNALGISEHNRYGGAGRRRYPRPRTVRRNAESYWLEMQMGWGPLLSDIDNAAAAIADLMVYEPPQVARVYGRAVHHLGYEKLIPGDHRFGDGDEYMEASHRCQIVVYYTFSDRQRAIAKQFGLTTFAATMWELTPFSWCVDYFIGIGQWLESLNAWQGLEFLNGCVSYTYEYELTRQQPGKGEYEKTYDYAGSLAYVRSYASSTGWEYKQKGHIFNRGLLNAFPTPAAPKLRLNPLDWTRRDTKLLNLLALYGQLKSK